MFADYLTRGVKAGLVAGLVFGLFVAVVANPLVGYADEATHDAGDGLDGHAHESEGADGGQEEHHDAVASTAVDEAASVVSAGLWAVLLGGVVFGVGYYFLEPAIPGSGTTRSYVLGLAGFVTVSGAPWLVLPPVAPGARQSLPATTRLLLYGGMMGAGAVTCLLAGVVYHRLRAAVGHGIAACGAVLPFGLLAGSTVLAPANPVQSALSPELHAGLTGAVVIGQVLLWLVLAAAHAAFARTDRSQTDGSTSGLDPARGAD